MEGNDPNQHLSHITTLWTLVHQAHGGPPDAVSAAQRVLMERYSGAVYRYLLGSLGELDAADELFQEFSLRFLRGDFRNANPQRGRFRDFVKTAVFHLIVDYRKRQYRQPRPLSPDVEEPAASAPSMADSEREFLMSWREELMARTWLALQEFEHATGQPHYPVLRFRTENPTLSSQELAEQVGARLGKAFSVHAVRQALHRAREKFADLLLDEVTQSLERPTREQLETELEDLGLLSYCRSALERRGR